MVHPRKVGDNVYIRTLHNEYRPEPPMPWSARKAINCSSDVASPHPRENAVKMIHAETTI